MGAHAIVDADLLLVISSHPHFETSRHPFEQMHRTTFSSRWVSDEQSMDAVFPSISGSEVSVPGQDLCTVYCPRPAILTPCRGRSNASVTCAAMPFHGGTFVSFTGNHRGVRHRTTALRSPRITLQLGWKQQLFA